MESKEYYDNTIKQIKKQINTISEDIEYLQKRKTIYEESLKFVQEEYTEVYSITTKE
jgi:prefoldin subunit 5